MILVVGISGASGAIYGIRLLEFLSQMSAIETHLVISKAAEKTIELETDYGIEAIRRLARFYHDANDIGASIASGSFQRDGMIVAPCTVKTLSALANSYSDNLLVRAGDVTLKERKPLVLLVRETPLHLGHIRNMLNVTEMGAIVLPPVPSFYSKPKTIDDIINQTVGRALDLVGVKHNILERWSGEG